MKLTPTVASTHPIHAFCKPESLHVQAGAANLAAINGPSHTNPTRLTFSSHLHSPHGDFHRPLLLALPTLPGTGLKLPCPEFITLDAL